LARDAQAKLALIVAQIYPSVHLSIHLIFPAFDEVNLVNFGPLTTQ